MRSLFLLSELLLCLSEIILILGSVAIVLTSGSLETNAFVQTALNTAPFHSASKEKKHSQKSSSEKIFLLIPKMFYALHSQPFCKAFAQKRILDISLIQSSNRSLSDGF